MMEEKARRVVFRVDADDKIGRGHLSRSIAAAEMIKHDFRVLFILSQNSERFSHRQLIDFDAVYLEDESDLPAFITKEDILWVDGYHFGEVWRAWIQPLVYKLILTDDLPEPLTYIDVIINYAPGIKREQYSGTNASYILAGLKYVLLRPGFLKAVADNPKTGDGAFVCFGGADPLGLGEAFVRELLSLGFRDNIYLVTTKGIDRSIFSGDTENLYILSGLSEQEMISYIRRSRVAVVSASVLSFEVMALRAPLFCFYYVENQRLIYNGLIHEEAAVGGGLVTDRADIAKALPLFTKFYNDPAHQKQIIEKQKELIDGQSGSRIIEFINNLLNDNA